MVQTGNLERLNGNGQDLSDRYRIIDADGSLMISESRVGVLDVMEALDQGESIYEIGATFNLSPLQVQTAATYIEKNRKVLEPQLAKAIQLRREREQYYQAIQTELQAKIAKLPMTPRRAAFFELRERNRRMDEEKVNALHP